MMTDPVSDMLTRIRNANMNKTSTVDCSFSRLKEGILSVLKKQGFILDYQVKDGKKFKLLEITLKYDEDGNTLFIKLQRESKPSCRVYKRVTEIAKVLNGYGVGIYSTSKGILSDGECRLSQIGGEYLCSIY